MCSHAPTESAPPVIAAVALGSNLGDRRAHIEAAFAALAELPATELIARSSVIETAPVGPQGQGPFLNAAAALRTSLAPRQLLMRLLAIERSRGRDRTGTTRWGARTLDLDLILYADLIIDEPGLVVPHPRMADRAFVLEPLAEVLPEMRVPRLDRTVRRLRDLLRSKE